MIARSPALGLAPHGGDLDAIAQSYGIPAGDLIDFSANINPLGPPPSLLRALRAAAGDRDALMRYPQPDGADLRAALATKLAIDPASIVIGNGAAALIDVAFRASAIRRCLVPLPAFSEYRRALECTSVELVPIALDAADDFRLPVAHVIAALASGTVDACLITNPHNPTGSLTARAEIEAILAAANASGATTIIDEAFIDYVPSESVATTAATTPRTVVIRSLTKFFAAPALRAGYAVCEPALAGRLRRTLPSWPVTTLASRAFTAALRDHAFERRTRTGNARERAELTRGLQALGVRVVPAAANFVLIALPPDAPRSGDLVAHLIRCDRLVLRDCASYEGLEPGAFLRVAVRSRPDNARMIAALARALR